MTNKEKFLGLVSAEKTSTLDNIKDRIENKARLRESQHIALKVLVKLDDLGWSQKELAAKMGVSPQQINKIVRGRENLTLETQIKLQEILNIPILASYYESKSENVEVIFQFNGEMPGFVMGETLFSGEYINSSNKSPVATINYDNARQEYSYKVAW